jgi:hypothetical protein
MIGWNALEGDARANLDRTMDDAEGRTGRPICCPAHPSIHQLVLRWMKDDMMLLLLALRPNGTNRHGPFQVLPLFLLYTHTAPARTTWLI